MNGYVKTDIMNPMTTGVKINEPQIYTAVQQGPAIQIRQTLPGAWPVVYAFIWYFRFDFMSWYNVGAGVPGNYPEAINPGFSMRELFLDRFISDARIQEDAGYPIRRVLTPWQ